MWRNLSANSSTTCSAKKFKLADAQAIASHPQALGQCSKWLDANLPNAKREITSSTAEAAKLSKTPTKNIVHSKLFSN